MKKNSKSPLQFNNKVFGNFLLWSIIISIVVLVVIYMDPSSGKKEITYSELQEMLFEFDNSYNDKNICESLDEYVWLDQMPKKGCYKVNSNVIEIRNKDDGYTEIDITEVKTNLEGEEAVKITYVTHADRNQLRENVLDKFPNLKYQYIQPTQSFWSYFMNFAPWLLIIVFWFVIMKRMQGGGQSGGIFSFAKSKARIISSKNTKVLFKDITTDDNFIVSSTVETDETITHEGKEYPLVKVEISSSSHPFYSGKERSGGTTGRIEKFNKKYNKQQ